MRSKIQIAFFGGFIGCLLVLTLGCKKQAVSVSTPGPLEEGGTRLKQGDLKGAEEAFRKYLQTAKPLVQEGMAKVANAYLQANKRERGYDFLIQFEAQVQSLPPIDRGAYYQLLGDLVSPEPKLREKAIAAYEKGYRIDPDNDQLLNNYGYVLADEGRDLQKAFQLTSRATQMNANNGVYRDSLGWVYYRMGKYEEALDEFKFAVETVPNNAEVRYHLAAVYYKLNRLQDAETELQKALGLNPKYEPAKKLLDEIRKR